MSRKKSGISTFTTEVLERRRAKGDDRTDWARVDAISEADLEAAIADDVEEANLAIDWSRATFSMPPPKETMTIRIDADVLAFFRKSGRGYQTRMNAVLRSFMDYSEDAERRRSR